jgi:hypothetical protein
MELKESLIRIWMLRERPEKFVCGGLNERTQ